MFDLIRKALLTGMGLAVLTAEKAEEFAKELVQKGQLTQEEGKKLAKELISKADQSSKEYEERIKQQVHKIISSMNIATKDDIADLSKKIDELKKK
ncbi:MAG: phasin family protein [Candidatus Aegiribacteria sp.]|nr:phasin family protein [Candidatus Aegiribacteria sp.]